MIPATVCRIVLATQTLVCGQVLPEREAFEVYLRVLTYDLPIVPFGENVSGLSRPFVVRQVDPGWPQALKASELFRREAHQQ